MIFTAKVTQHSWGKKKHSKGQRWMNDNTGRVQQRSFVAMINSVNLILCGIKSD